jgi:hypothetical protein
MLDIDDFIQSPVLAFKPCDISRVLERDGVKPAIESSRARERRDGGIEDHGSWRMWFVAMSDSFY